ncbi:MAG: hypothetical protein R3F62_20390 [Planctomycetota bacterium]
MPIPFTCSCGYSGEEDDALLGKLSACPRCGELQRVGGEQRKGVRADRPQPPAWADRPAPAQAKHDPYAPPASTSPYAPPQAEWSQPGPGRYGDLPPRDLEHEAHVIAIGAWNQIGGALLVAFGLLGGLMFLGGAAASKGQGPALIAVFGAFLFVFVLLGGAMFVVGAGLRSMKNWARWVTGVLIVLQLLSSAVNVIQQPSAILGAGISTAWNVAILWALFCERANALFDASYQQTFLRSPGQPRWTASPFFWLPFVMCLLGCCLAAAAGGMVGAMR